MRTAPVYTDDIIGEVVTATAVKILPEIQANEAAALGKTLIKNVRFSQSTFDELIETLAQLDTSGTERFLKYPLVQLVQDVTIERGQEPGVYGSTLLNIIFAHQTVDTYKTEERSAKVFKPVLYPLYYQFMEDLKKSKWVFGNYTQTGEFRHRLIEHRFWGSGKLQGQKNRLNDYVDALEIQNLNVKFNFSNC